MLFAPILAAVAAFTVSSRLEVPIQRIYVPVVVGSASELHDNKADGIDLTDVTQAQIDAGKAALEDAGIPADRIAVWSQIAKTYAPGGDKNVTIGVLVVDLGPPNEAGALASKLPLVKQRGLMFGWNQFVAVDCKDMQTRINRQLQAEAKNLMAHYGPSAKLLSLDRTTDPMTGAFDPIPMCPEKAKPLVNSAISFGRAPTGTPAEFTMHVSANARFSYVAPVATPAPPPDATATFPFSTFGFPSPIIRHENRQFVLKGGGFAATPGASEVSVPVQVGLGVFYHQTQASLDNAVHKARDLGVASDDLFVDAESRQLFVRLRSVTHDRWQQLQTALWGGNGESYVFIRDCAPYAPYARDLALERSHMLAKAAASALKMPLGPLVVQTDWAGSDTTATCGVDGSGSMPSLVKYVGLHGRAMTGEPNYAWFSASVYAAWQLGATAPVIASQSIVERLVPVIRGTGTAEEVTGVATLSPDAYFIRQQSQNDFVYSVIAAGGGPPPKDAGNVITDCEDAQERGLVNAVRVAQLEHPVRAFYAKPAELRSISCLSADYIGRTFSSMPTMYASSSGTGAPQAEDTIAVFP